MADAMYLLREALGGLSKQLSEQGGSLERIRKAIVGRLDWQPVRNNAARILTHDTNSTTQAFHNILEVFGVPAASCEVISVGGGSLEININGEGWVSVNIGDLWEDETINEVGIRATTAAAGTARVRIGTYAGKVVA